MKRMGRIFGLSVMVGLMGAPAMASDVFVKDATGVAVSASEMQVAAELIRTSVPQVDGFQLTLDQKKAEVVLQPKLLRLDETLMLSIQKIKGDSVVGSDQIKVSDFDELDLVALRLTRAILEGKPVRDSERVDEVTRAEQQLVGRRKEAAKNWVLGFGPHTSGSMENDSTLFNFHLGYSWLVKSQSEVKLFWDSAAGSGSHSASLSYLGLGYTHLFSIGDRSPTLTAEMGYGGASYSSDASPAIESVKGFVGGVGAGYRLFRTSSINLDLQLRAALVFNKGRAGNPVVSGFRLSLYF